MNYKKNILTKTTIRLILFLPTLLTPLHFSYGEIPQFNLDEILPDETIKQILGYLDPVHLKETQKVNWRWNAISNEVYRENYTRLSAPDLLGLRNKILQEKAMTADPIQIELLDLWIKKIESVIPNRAYVYRYRDRYRPYYPRLRNRIYLPDYNVVVAPNEHDSSFSVHYRNHLSYKEERFIYGRYEEKDYVGIIPLSIETLSDLVTLANINKKKLLLIQDLTQKKQHWLPAKTQLRKLLNHLPFVSSNQNQPIIDTGLAIKTPEVHAPFLYTFGEQFDVFYLPKFKLIVKLPTDNNASGIPNFLAHFSTAYRAPENYRPQSKRHLYQIPTEDIHTILTLAKLSHISRTLSSQVTLRDFSLSLLRVVIQ